MLFYYYIIVFSVSLQYFANWWKKSISFVWRIADRTGRSISLDHVTHLIKPNIATHKSGAQKMDLQYFRRLNLNMIKTVGKVFINIQYIFLKK